MMQVQTFRMVFLSDSTPKTLVVQRADCDGNPAFYTVWLFLVYLRLDQVVTINFCCHTGEVLLTKQCGDVNPIFESPPNFKEICNVCFDAIDCDHVTQVKAYGECVCRFWNISRVDSGLTLQWIKDEHTEDEKLDEKLQCVLWTIQVFMHAYPVKERCKIDFDVPEWIFRKLLQSSICGQEIGDSLVKMGLLGLRNVDDVMRSLETLRDRNIIEYKDSNTSK